MKLKPKMLLGIGIPLVAVFLIVGFAISTMASSALSESKQRSMYEMGEHYANAIDKIVEMNRVAVETATVNWDEAMPEGEALHEALLHMAERPGVVSAYIGRSKVSQPLIVRSKLSGTSCGTSRSARRERSSS